LSGNSSVVLGDQYTPCITCLKEDVLTA
jgi:hypothetical protein